MDWFLYDRDLRHERVKVVLFQYETFVELFCFRFESVWNTKWRMRTNV